MMSNRELAKKIVEAVNEESSNYDAIERVEEIINTIIKIKEPVDIELNTTAVWVSYATAGMEYDLVGKSFTEREAYIKLAEFWGLDYESELTLFLKNNKGTEEDFQKELCFDGEGKIECIRLN